MRPPLDEYLMRLAEVAATRSTCVRRDVGCVLADSRGRVLAIGYNGVASGMLHCKDENPCQGYDLPPGQDACEAVHAEQNAVLQCHDADKIDTAYVTLSPWTCSESRTSSAILSIFIPSSSLPSGTHAATRMRGS